MEREPLSACEAMIMKVIWDQKGDISVPELIDLIRSVTREITREQQ